MQFLDFAYNPWLSAASLLVALIAGFTGLSLTQGLSQKSTVQKKVSIAMASIALGGGIWSMHFVAMLGLKLPILFYYDAAVTLASALVAILVVGIALLILHFRERTTASRIFAGTIVGLGVLAMHYIGMAGLELCKAIYTAPGIALAIVASCVLNIAAFWIAYSKRKHRNILMGTICFGLAVFAVHFFAMSGTGFVAVASSNEVGPIISNEVMAIGVVTTSFVLCGAFLLTGVTFLDPTHTRAQMDANQTPEDLAPVGPRETATPTTSQIPYERDGRTLFIDAATVSAIRADGHYTQIVAAKGQYFCAWSIAEAQKRLSPIQFLKTHRSYLINPSHVISFERLKDNGICHMDTPDLAKVPVSRMHLRAVREALGV